MSDNRMSLSLEDFNGRGGRSLNLSGFVEIQKAQADLIEKAKGEGSRGGKVIGHTKSGKPIYDTSNHAKHANFNKEDHLDAAKLHKKHADKENEEDTIMSGMRAEHHEKQADEHSKFAKTAKSEDDKADEAYDKFKNNVKEAFDGKNKSNKSK